MVLKIFAVRDRAARAYITPFFLPTREMALREFQRAATDEEHAFARFSEDYSLYELGEFDPESGALLVQDQPEFVISAVLAKTIEAVRQAQAGQVEGA